MKTTKVLAAAGALALILGASACTEKTTDCEKKCDKTVSFSTVKKDKSFVLKGSAEDYNADEDLTYYCSATVLVPESLDGHDVWTLREAVAKAAFDTTATECSGELVYKIFSEIASKSAGGTYTATETSDSQSSADGSFTVSGKVAALTPGYLAYCVRTSSYEPRAAHGMYKASYINYDLTEGKVFTLTDVVTAEGLDKLPQTLKTIADSMRDYVGPTELTALPADGNFYINIDGELVFVYQPYEIASYSQGIIEVPVPAYLISDLLTPYGKTILDL